MAKAIWAGYLHSISTPEEPHHENCPPGEDSWCWYKRALHAEPVDPERIARAEKAHQAPQKKRREASKLAQQRAQQEATRAEGGPSCVGRVQGFIYFPCQKKIIKWTHKTDCGMCIMSTDVVLSISIVICLCFISQFCCRIVKSKRILRFSQFDIFV